MSAWEKQSNQVEALTFWETEERQCQLKRSSATMQRHLPTGGKTTDIVSRRETEQQCRGTYPLDSREQAMKKMRREKRDQQSKRCTHCRAGKGNVSREEIKQ